MMKAALGTIKRFLRDKVLVRHLSIAVEMLDTVYR